MSKRATSTKIKRTSEQQAKRKEAARLQEIAETAAFTGLPDAQITPDRMVIVPAARDNGKIIASHTVRKMTRIEIMRRSGMLNDDEAAACTWYADVHAMAFDTVSVTANYANEGGGTGGTPSHCLSGRYAEQIEARDNYAFAVRYVPPHYRPMFEMVVCSNSTIAQAMEADASVSERTNYRRARAVVKYCAGLLHTGILHLLPIAT